MARRPKIESPRSKFKAPVVEVAEEPKAPAEETKTAAPQPGRHIGPAVLIMIGTPHPVRRRRKIQQGV
jgi:hypothetical protein